ncbi:MAG: iron-containing alcohol dehydrogenase [Proteobacteria bacterium]|nr:iron-containing alcohol dehydrogenase [Pseudomonadota bacterium]
MFSPYYRTEPERETVFVVDPRPFKFGVGAIREIGVEATTLGIARVAVFTDPRVGELAATASALDSLLSAGIDTVVYDRVAVEPTDQSFVSAAEFMRDGSFDGIVSIGGGSVIDTAKAAALYASYPADFLSYVNPPIGEGKSVPGPLLPHIACPTTAGTGSEATGVAVFDLMSRRLKTGISSGYLKPALSIIDPEFTFSLPPLVTAATGFDVLTHAIESFTAIAYTRRPTPADPRQRPPYQGANPYSDLGSVEAIRLGGRYLLRAVQSGDDHEARIAMMYAATLAGVSFGNAGVHIPHAMSYSVAGAIRDYSPAGWPADHPLCPHGISVVVNAPAAFRFTASAAPKRHLAAARALGADTEGVALEEAGNALADKLVDMMRAAGIPNGLSALGYRPDDLTTLATGAHQQQRLLRQSPRPIDQEQLHKLYRDAMKYW